MRTIFLSLLLSVCLFTGCKRNEKDDVPQPVSAYTLWAEGQFPVTHNLLPLATDAEGNTYMAGYQAGGATFGSVSMPGGYRSSFIIKYNVAGKVVWNKNMPLVDVKAFNVSPTGDIYMTGSTIGLTGLTDGTIPPNLEQLPPTFFVARYNSSGELLWVRQSDSKDIVVWTAMDRVTGTALTVNDQGVVSVAGVFKYKVSLDNLVLESYDSNVFIAQYDASGNIIWAKQIESSGDVYKEEDIYLTSDKAGNMYVHVGLFSLSVLDDFTINGSFEFPWYLAKYNASGKVLWVKHTEEDGISRYRKILTDATGNSFISTTSSVSEGSRIYMTKYSPSGEVSWVRPIGNGGTFVVTENLQIDNQGNLCLLGMYFSFRESSLTIGTTTLTTQKGKNNHFIARYTPTGDLIGVQSVDAISEEHKKCNVLLNKTDNITFFVGKQNNRYVLGQTKAQYK